MSEFHPKYPRYRGRFAPSPTGPLHFGSLVSAVASYLQAKAQAGEWLVRIEDIDPPREPAGAADDILRTLEAYGLNWDGPVLYQSTRRDGYEEALLDLNRQHFTYPCTCSRKQIQEALSRSNKTVYPETCRGATTTKSPHATRVKTEFQDIPIRDAIQGLFTQNIREHVGDFVVKRADGFYAYQLAVVVDDAYQNITEIVRGSDLLDNTPRQAYLQRLLDFPLLQYAHIPIATSNGDKMSKQTKAPPVSRQNPLETGVQVLKFLGQKVPDQWEFATVDELWQWAIRHWSLAAIPKTRSLEYGARRENT
ncbi:MAG: tRNA glutamyl-Q(34) synthetase GluQRS [Gammaproteobacteria bacterium]